MWTTVCNTIYASRRGDWLKLCRFIPILKLLFHWLIIDFYDCYDFVSAIELPVWRHSTYERLPVDIWSHTDVTNGARSTSSRHLGLHGIVYFTVCIHSLCWGCRYCSPSLKYNLNLWTTSFTYTVLTSSISNITWLVSTTFPAPKSQQANINHHSNSIYWHHSWAFPDLSLLITHSPIW